MKTIKLLFILLAILQISCNSKTNDEIESDEIQEEDTANTLVSNTTSDCSFQDGTYSATVDYNNSETGHSATYTLNVEVQDCQVIQINFPNGGYVDEDHITTADIDEDGNAAVEGEDGKTYEISIDN